jgi:hypothetical protein
MTWKRPKLQISDYLIQSWILRKLLIASYFGNQLQIINYSYSATNQEDIHMFVWKSALLLQVWKSCVFYDYQLQLLILAKERQTQYSECSIRKHKVNLETSGLLSQAARSSNESQVYRKLLNWFQDKQDFISPVISARKMETSSDSHWKIKDR